MKVFNSMTRRKEEFKPVHEGKVGIYACGPTVYDYFHIGNARPFITFDVLRRQLEREGYEVTFVQNFTDIDDKMIKRANEEGITVKELADRFIKEYYVDALLEKNVDEPKLDVLAQFYSEYDTEVKECIFLNRKQLYGWGMYWDYPRYALSSVAMIMDPEHGAVEYRPAALYYLDARKKNRAKLSFEPLHAYRASVRKSLFKDDRYLLVTMPQEVTEPRFEEVIADYLKPRTIQNEFGTFTLDRDYDWFSGETEILGRTCQITLDTGPGGTDASAAEAVLKEILKDPEALIKGAKNFAADDMYDSLEDWYDEPLTREEFMERIGMPDIAISNDGSVSLFFDGTELFAGHTVIVDMNRDGTFDDAYLAG